MRQLFRIFFMEIKKGQKELPYALAASLLFLVILGAVFYSASRILYQQEDISKADVAIVSNDTNDEYLDLAINFIKHMDSVSVALNFVRMSEEEALEAMEEKDIIAILFLPDNLINGILSGNNEPIRVAFSTEDAFHCVYLMEITRAGGRLLSSAQADIYATGELFRSYGATDYLSTAFDDINNFNLNYALKRNRLFDESETSLNGSTSTTLFFAVSGILLGLMFLTSAFPAMLRRENKEFYQILFSSNVPSSLYMLARVLSFSFLLLVLQVAYLFILSLIPIMKESDFLCISWNLKTIMVLFLNSLFLSCFAHLCFLISQDISGGILTIYCCSSILIFCSGCIIPAVFFPAGLQRIAGVLPTTYLHSNLLQILGNSDYTIREGIYYGPVFLYIAILLSLCILIFHYRRRTYKV